MIVIITQDCLEIELPEADVCFCDPPDGINLKYNGFKDKIDNYREFCRSFLVKALSAAKRGVWISFNSRHTLAMAAAVQEL